MAKAAYGRTVCWFRGKGISTAGGGVHHYRKHVRDGMLTECRGRITGTYFELTALGRTEYQKRLRE